MPLNKKTCFATNIYQFLNPSAAVDHAKWRTAIYELRNKDPGRVVSNHLGWQSSVPLQTIPQLDDLGRFIFQCINEVASDDDWALDKFSVVMEGWVNINGKAALNNFHNHPNTLLSGCYYLDTPPGSGDIVFRDPREVAYVFQPPYRNGNKTPVLTTTPQAGMLLVFPAWLLHAVAANMSDADRVSIAFNASVVPKPVGSGTR